MFMEIRDKGPLPQGVCVISSWSKYNHQTFSLLQISNEMTSEVADLGVCTWVYLWMR